MIVAHENEASISEKFSMCFTGKESMTEQQTMNYRSYIKQ